MVSAHPLSIKESGSQDRVAKELTAKIHTYLKQAEQFGFSGSVLVGMNGKVILNGGYGLADRSRRVAVRPDTVFDIGSVTKQFTAAAILKLEMLGKLQTGDLIGKYLEGVPPDKAEVTIHHLLTHTAGLPEYSGGDYEEAERDETIKKILLIPLSFQPGKQMQYSNPGYSLLAAIVERVSGQSYESFLQEYLFKPAAMTQTGYVVPKFNLATLPRGYNGKMDRGTPRDHPWSPTGPYWNLLGNGGLLSNTEDMYKWYRSLQDETILSAELKKKLFTPFLNNYSYGWRVTKTEYGVAIGHDGSNDVGFNAQMKWFADRDIVVIVMSNAGEYNRSNIYSNIVGNKLTRLIFGEVLPPQRAPSFIQLDSLALKKYEGVYQLPSGAKFLVSLQGDQLMIEPVGQEAIKILAFTPAGYVQFYDDASVRTQAIVSGILKKDFQALGESLVSENALTRYRTLLEQRLSAWETSDGTLKGFDVLGTVPGWWSDNPTPVTFVELRFEKRSHVFRFHWIDGKIRGLGGETIPNPAATPLRPTSANSFQGWHLSFGNPIDVLFKRQQKPDAELQLNINGRRFKAIKVVAT
jgi:CubicO group peptidase (beta-lactamase class C family)